MKKKFLNCNFALAKEDQYIEMKDYVKNKLFKKNINTNYQMV